MKTAFYLFDTVCRFSSKRILVCKRVETDVYLFLRTLNFSRKSRKSQGDPLKSYEELGIFGGLRLSQFLSNLTADHYFWCSRGVPCCFEGVPGYYGMFQGCSGVVPGCSGLFQGYSGDVPGCSGVFRGVPGFTDTRIHCN